MSDPETHLVPPAPMPATSPAQGNSTPIVSHTQEHPTLPPHTLTNRSTLASPEPFIRLFLLAWAIRYIPRGLFSELFEKNTVGLIRKPVSRFIDWSVLNRMESKIGKVLTENKTLVAEAKAAGVKAGEINPALFDKLKPFVSQWRGKVGKEVQHIVADAVATEEGGFALAKSSKSTLRDLVRGKLDDVAYALSLFVGSSALSLNYSRLVRADIQNLFRETVAYERGIPQEKVTFRDIANSDNQIIQGTIANYRSKLKVRLGSDALFLGSAALKSTPLTDLVLGLKGAQMFHETWQRKPTLFEDLVTFVNNKINPINGLGQPISIGEVFDLYQHYAQAYTPERAFTGVIEHAKTEGVLWAGNQPVFQRLTELMNKTYAYKHQSILDNATGQTVLQADFPLPKLIYLLGHNLIDLNNPKQSLATIEVANSQGIGAVKEMNAMLKQGKSLDEIIAHYHVKLPKIEAALQPEPENGILTKGQQMAVGEALQTAPTTRIDADTAVHHSEPQQTAALSV